jgi:hypothetical protein
VVRNAITADGAPVADRSSGDDRYRSSRFPHNESPACSGWYDACASKFTEAALKALTELETIMKRIVAIAGAFSLIAGTCAYAQTNTNPTRPADQGTQNTQPGTDSQSMGRAADAGSAKPASGTLMQQRENAMSPQGASGVNTTGKMKQ